MLNILFVDDDVIEVMTVKRHLKKFSDANLLYASSYAEGCKIIETTNINLVFTDYNLGDGIGYDFTNDYPELKIIILSGTSLVNADKKALESKKIESIVKDFDLNYIKRVDTIISETIATSK